MSVVMFVVGAIAAVVGVVLVAAGIPVKEFSFGNTLILAGTVAIVGGFIVFGLGSVVAQLQRVADMLGARPAARNGRLLESFEQAGARLGQSPGRIPFPPKPKTSPAEQHDAEPPFAVASHSGETRNEAAEHGFAPALRNPEEPAFADAEANETSLMPRQAPPVATRANPDFLEPTRPPAARGANGSSAVADRSAPLGIGWRPPAPPPRPPQPNYFDAMWPPEPRSAKPANADEKPARAEPPMRDTGMGESVMREPAEPKQVGAAKLSAPQQASEVRAVPILKSGAIDGMGYTLYVDGSIEAELPHGTLRFASIGELRVHLEQNT